MLMQSRRKGTRPRLGAGKDARPSGTWSIGLNAAAPQTAHGDRPLYAPSTRELLRIPKRSLLPSGHRTAPRSPRPKDYLIRSIGPPPVLPFATTVVVAATTAIALRKPT